LRNYESGDVSSELNQWDMVFLYDESLAGSRLKDDMDSSRTGATSSVPVLSGPPSPSAQLRGLRISIGTTSFPPAPDRYSIPGERTINTVNSALGMRRSVGWQAQIPYLPNRESPSPWYCRTRRRHAGERAREVVPLVHDLVGSPHVSIKSIKNGQPASLPAAARSEDFPALPAKLASVAQLNQTGMSTFA